MTKAADTKTWSWILNDLNDEQRKAVIHLDGPLLILAGAGSGKTRVLTYRIAHIIASGKAEPEQILAMTFTNKAAGEMRERVHHLTPESISTMWVGTFHSLFARLLRREAERLGYSSSFTIYDSDDQQTLIKLIQQDMQVSTQQYPPKLIAYSISRAKNALVSPAEFQKSTQSPVDEIIARIFPEYNRRLRQNNAMDFDDLLIKPLELFQLYPLIKEYYQDRFRFILVDEYQDTNRAQYLVLKELADKYKNICVVGDDDQSIYRWRGAELRNILEFERDYSNCAKYRLEQNYRSTPAILGLAHSVVINNTQRHAKKLWTAKKDGEPVTLLSVYDAHEEARVIVDKISSEFRAGDRRFGDFAVLYRINAQSRVLEEGLRLEGIPYIIVGGIKFYERKEIKDVLAYLRALVNPSDNVSLKRIINYPTRGLGDSTLQKVERFAREKQLSLFASLEMVHEISGLPSKTVDRLRNFVELIKRYRQLIGAVSPYELASTLVDELGIFREFKQEGTIDSASRSENVRELLDAVHEFSLTHQDASLDSYLQQVSLVTDIDHWDDRANAVTLMTLHAAKGLEFAVVFITGLEDGLFPLSRSLENPHDLEEERRLFYVGATRAKDKLYLVWAKNRKRFGETRSYKSRFLKEIDLRFVDTQESYRLQRAHNDQIKISWSGEEMPAYEDFSQEYPEYSPGLRVRHEKFGKGTILKVEASTGGTKLVVLFDQGGQKRLVLPYAKLEIL